MPLYSIVARDHPDALERRLAVRGQHIALGDRLAAEGALVFGAAIMDDDTMRGSILIARFDDRAALQAWLDVEPYVTANVWAEVQIDEIRVGPTFAHRFPDLASS
jgi:uncharacterized protein